MDTISFGEKKKIFVLQADGICEAVIHNLALKNGLSSLW